MEISFKLRCHLRSDLVFKPRFDSYLLHFELLPVSLAQVGNFLFNFFKLCLPKVFFILDPLFENFFRLFFCRFHFSFLIFFKADFYGSYLVLVRLKNLLTISFPFSFGFYQIILQGVSLIQKINAGFVLLCFKVSFIFL